MFFNGPALTHTASVLPPARRSLLEQPAVEWSSDNRGEPGQDTSSTDSVKQVMLVISLLCSVGI